MSSRLTYVHAAPHRIWPRRPRQASPPPDPPCRCKDVAWLWRLHQGGTAPPNRQQEWEDYTTADLLAPAPLPPPLVARARPPHTHATASGGGERNKRERERRVGRALSLSLSIEAIEARYRAMKGCLASMLDLYFLRWPYRPVHVG